VDKGLVASQPDASMACLPQADGKGSWKRAAGQKHVGLHSQAAMKDTLWSLCGVCTHLWPLVCDVGSPPATCRRHRPG
jgi:hypothetical protein